MPVRLGMMETKEIEDFLESKDSPETTDNPGRGALMSVQLHISAHFIQSHSLYRFQHQLAATISWSD